jgi:hypothetical protein
MVRSSIRAGSCGRFFTIVGLIDLLEAGVRAGRQGRIADYFHPLDFVIIDILDYLPH